MGQRLNIEIKDGNGITLANGYYHWSAYTGSAIELVETIIETNEDIECNSLLERAVKLLESTGAGINDFEKTRIEADSTNKFDGIDFKPCVDRNRGLISVTPEGIMDTRKWEEGRVNIDIENQTIDFDVYWEDDIDNFISYQFEDTNVDELSMNEKEALLIHDGMCRLKWGYEDFECIPFNNFYKIADLVEDNADGFYTPEMMVITWIC